MLLLEIVSIKSLIFCLENTGYISGIWIEPCQSVSWKWSYAHFLPHSVPLLPAISTGGRVRHINSTSDHRPTVVLCHSCDSSFRVGTNSPSNKWNFSRSSPAVSPVWLLTNDVRSWMIPNRHILHLRDIHLKNIKQCLRLASNIMCRNAVNTYNNSRNKGDKIETCTAGDYVQYGDYSLPPWFFVLHPRYGRGGPTQRQNWLK